MQSWVIVLIVIIAAVIADIVYLIRRKKSGKCSCGHDCGTCGGCCKCNK
ncbi:MAG: FeoB-associated Cys-rich membrane protein [Clostridia bacterium]|nr:FeoB-associated Cys-rich membrane protein [Clostridia bacterium]